jgi:hypothetical protein
MTMLMSLFGALFVYPFLLRPFRPSHAGRHLMMIGIMALQTISERVFAAKHG